MFANLLVNQAIVCMLVGLLVAVAIIDVRHLTISNRYCAAVVLLYPFYVATAPFGVDWIDGAIVGAVALTIGFLLFSMRFAGGGDVKFFAAISLWAGSHLLLEYVFVTAVAGGVIALCMLLHRRFTSTRTASSGAMTHALASANVFLGELMMDPGSAVASSAAPASPGSNGAIDPSTKPHPGGPQPVGELPYGAAISLGGIVVAAMLLMRG
ncbi:MAG TPA: prepilin peptidase [Candidatus Angelobacter sp.]|nr:prepilin peptidase [Candidatus Angelobacter sp.]